MQSAQGQSDAAAGPEVPAPAALRADGASAAPQRPALPAELPARQLARLSLLGHRAGSISAIVAAIVGAPVSSSERTVCVPGAAQQEAKRNDALQTRDRYVHRARYGPGSATHRSTSFRAASRPGHAGQPGTLHFHSRRSSRCCAPFLRVRMPADQNQKSIWAVFGALFLALWLAAIDQTVVSTALPTMVAELGGLSYLSWVVTAYLLTSTVAGPLYGKFGDLYGRKIVLQVAIVVFLTGSALCGIAQNMLQLILFRALEGIGGGGLIVVTIAVIGDLIPPRERGRYH